MKYKITMGRVDVKNTIASMCEMGFLIGVGVILYLITKYTLGVWIKGTAFGQSWTPYYWIIPATLMYIRRGALEAIITGFGTMILFSIIGGIYIVSPLSFILDYFSPFIGITIAGLLCVFIKNRNYRIVIFILLASSFTCLGSYLSGVIFYSKFAPVGWGAEVYSLVYNASATLSAVILTLVIFVPLLIYNKNHILIRKYPSIWPIKLKKINQINLVIQNNITTKT